MEYLQARLTAAIPHLVIDSPVWDLFDGCEQKGTDACFSLAYADITDGEIGAGTMILG